MKHPYAAVIVIIERLRKGWPQ